MKSNNLTQTKTKQNKYGSVYMTFDHVPDHAPKTPCTVCVQYMKLSALDSMYTQVDQRTSN